ncbi:MAG: hypothetical protein R2710_06460 [Acidimicrobiales bacterium]
MADHRLLPPARRSPLDLAVELGPLLESQSETHDRTGRLSDAALGALVDANLFGVLVPETLGGFEASPTEALDTFAEVSAPMAPQAGCSRPVRSPTPSPGRSSPTTPSTRSSAHACRSSPAVAHRGPGHAGRRRPPTGRTLGIRERHSPRHPPPQRWLHHR